MKMSNSRFSKGQVLSVIDFNHLPNYLKKNKEKFKEWLE